MDELGGGGRIAPTLANDGTTAQENKGRSIHEHADAGEEEH
jgi:hypothetical protein